jgi:multidrug efflux system outer membrane protein
MSNQMTQGLSVMAAALLLTACSMAPTYERPASPLAADWPALGLPTAGAAQAGQAGQAASAIEWQTFFSDPQLRQLIAVALRNNRDLRIAVLTIEQTRAQFQISRANQLPSVGAAVSGLRQPNPNGNGHISSVYTAGLAMTAYEIDFFGRVASLKDAALSLYLASEEGRRTAQIALVAAVANGYLSLLADQELLAITQQTLDSRVVSLKLSQLRFDNGVSAELDLRQSQSLVEAARVSLAQLQRQRALDENALSLLLGQPLGGDLTALLPLGQGLADRPVMANVPAGLPSDLLILRPDIRQAEQQLLAANANIGAARAAFFPKISLTASAGSGSNNLAGLFDSGTYGWTLAPQLFLPLFDAGRNQAGLEVSKATLDIAVAQYDKAIQTAFREVADALAGRATLGVQLQAQQAQSTAEAVRFKLSVLRYENGVASQLDRLDAQRALLAARQAVVLVRLQQLQNQVTLYKTLGGGWTAVTQSVTAKTP